MKKHQFLLIFGLFFTFYFTWSFSCRAEGQTQKTSKALNLSSRFVSKHNPEEICLLREGIKRSRSVSARLLTHKVRSMMAGIFWIVQFVEQDASFDAVFPEYVHLLTRLHEEGKGEAVGHIASRLVKNAFRRAVPNLKDIFDPTLVDKWRFLSVLPLLYKYKVAPKSFLAFYKKRFPKGFVVPKSMNFSQAMQQKKFEQLGNLLRREHRLFGFQQKYPRSPLKLPVSVLQKYLKALGKLKPSFSWKQDPDDYIVQTILMKRIAFALHGSKSHAKLRQMVRQYFQKEWKTIRYKTDDLELLAQSIQGMSVVNSSASGSIVEAVGYLSSRQNANGSWGKAAKGASDLEIVRPTFHALLALHTTHRFLKGQKKDKGESSIGWILGSSCRLSQGLPQKFESRYNPAAVCLTRKAIVASKSRLERSLLAGLHWLAQVSESNKKLGRIFPEYVGILHRVRKQMGASEISGYIAEMLLRKAFQRMQSRLTDAFEATLTDRWRFLSLVPLLYTYKIPQKQYKAWYKRHFPTSLPFLTSKALQSAIRDRDLRSLADALERERLVRFIRKNHKGNPYVTRPDKLTQLRKQTSVVLRTQKGRESREDYVDRIFFLLARNKSLGSLEREFPKVREQIDHLELLGRVVANVLHSRKLAIQGTISYLISRQHLDGSWGKDDNFRRGARASIRPTLAVLEALTGYRKRSPASRPASAPARLPKWATHGSCVLANGLPPAFRTRQSPTTLCLIRQAIRRNPMKLEKSVLAGLHWMISQVEKDAPYYFVFEIYVGVLDRVTRLGKQTAAAKMAQRLLKEAFRRSKARIDDIFSRDLAGKWRFINIIPLLYKYKIPLGPYVKFYNSLPKGDKRVSNKLTFAQCIKQRKFQSLTEYLGAEFRLHQLHTRFPTSPFKVPKSKLVAYLKQLEALPLSDTLASHPNRYLEQGYFVANFLLMFREMGSIPLSNSPLVSRYYHYLLKHFKAIRYKASDSDLLAATVHSLSLYSNGLDASLKEATRYLLALQHTVGSWGTDADFKSKDAYKVMQPTWSVLQALTAQALPTSKNPSKWPAGSSCHRPKGLPPAFHSKYNAEEVKLMREGIVKTKSRVERSLLGGMHWLVWVMEKEANFEEGFGDYTTMMSEMAVYGRGTLPGKIAERLLKNAFHRAATRLPKIFEKNMADKGDFTTILYMLYKFNVPKGPFIKFYKSYFPPGQPTPHKVPFKEAWKKRNYDILGTYIIDESFLDIFLRNNPNNPFKLRKSQLKGYIALLEKLPFIHGKDNFQGYNSQNYFITHIVLAMNHYGESPLPNTPLTRRILAYFDKHFANVRFNVKDLDLLAEFIYCYKIYGKGNRPDVVEATNYMMDLQHEDGSWGTDTDFGGTLYQSIHPTWAVITGMVDIKSQWKDKPTSRSKQNSLPAKR